MRAKPRIFLSILIVISLIDAEAYSQSPVTIERVPDGGLQPLLFSDEAQRLHLVYFKPDFNDGKQSKVGSLYYRQLLSTGLWSPAEPISDDFSRGDAVRKASAVADIHGRIHVVWVTLNPLGYWYSRRSEGRFNTPRLISDTELIGIETEASISSYEDAISVVWHAGDLMSESTRQVYRVLSLDGGESFSKAKSISDPRLGACACCGLTSEFTPEGDYIVAYRSAIADTGRHMQVLKLEDAMTTVNVGNWDLSTCPVSSNNLVNGWLVFETKGDIFISNVRSDQPIGLPVARSATRLKHPGIATGSQGDQLVVFAEGDGYFTGGEMILIWRDMDGNTMKGPNTTSMRIPDYSVATVGWGRDVGFMVLY